MKLAALVLSSAGTLFGQAAVEAGLGASRAAVSTAPAAGIGKSVAGALGALDKTLKGAASGSETTTQVITLRSSSAAPASKTEAKVYEDVRQAETGMAYAELIERFGPAALEVAGEGGIRKLSYPRKDGSTQVEVKDGKVTAVNAARVQ